MNNRVGDLTAMAKAIEQVIQKHLKRKEKPAITLAFTGELTSWDDLHYILNSNRLEAVGIFRQTADQLVMRST